jgi:hypothetical protein
LGVDDVKGGNKKFFEPDKLSPSKPYDYNPANISPGKTN